MKTDETLQKDVMEEIRWEPQLQGIASQIGVTAKNGMVTLSGIVDSYSKKIAAERAAQRVLGVNVVAVDLEVKMDGRHERTDIEIAQAINEVLKWNSVVNQDQVEVKVDDGWVYLTGATSWDFERKAAASAIKNLRGVKGVINNIKLKPSTIDPKQIKRKISHAFHRSATIDSTAIDVKVSGNHVVLTGKVRSWPEKREAEKAAWASPGVTVVENNLIVDSSILVS